MSQNVMYELFIQSVIRCVHLMYEQVYVIAKATFKKNCNSSTRFSELNFQTLISKCFISAREYIHMQT